MSNLADHYFREAIRAREMAEEVWEPGLTGILVDVADQYEVLAEQTRQTDEVYKSLLEH
jgi:hypothetical protein